MISTARVRVDELYRSNSSRFLDIGRTQHVEPKLCRETLHQVYSRLRRIPPTSYSCYRTIVVRPTDQRRQKIPIRRARAKKRRRRRPLRVRENGQGTPPQLTNDYLIRLLLLLLLAATAAMHLFIDEAAARAPLTKTCCCCCFCGAAAVAATALLLLLLLVLLLVLVLL